MINEDSMKKSEALFKMIETFLPETMSPIAVAFFTAHLAESYKMPLTNVILALKYLDVEDGE